MISSIPFSRVVISRRESGCPALYGRLLVAAAILTPARPRHFTRKTAALRRPRPVRPQRPITRKSTPQIPRHNLAGIPNKPIPQRRRAAALQRGLGRHGTLLDEVWSPVNEPGSWHHVVDRAIHVTGCATNDRHPPTNVPRSSTGAHGSSDHGRGGATDGFESPTYARESPTQMP